MTPTIHVAFEELTEPVITSKRWPECHFYRNDSMVGYMFICLEEFDGLRSFLHEDISRRAQSKCFQPISSRTTEGCVSVFHYLVFSLKAT